MRWELHDAQHRQRILVAVSREGHCLNDLLYRWQAGALAADIIAVASSYPDFESLAAGYGVPYHALPGPGATGEERDAALLDLVAEHRVELVVLARYMQILGPGPAARWPVERSTSITRSCPRSRERGRTRRRTRAASSSSAQPPITSRRSSTRGRSSSRRWRASTTRTASPRWRASAVTSSAWRWHARCAGTSSIACCFTVTGPSSSADALTVRVPSG